MVSMYLISVALLAAMLLGIDGNNTGGLSDGEVQAQCQKDPTAVFPHPGQCQLYYNCSSQGSVSSSVQHLEECDFPQLFSAVTSRCEPFDDVMCGARVEPFDCDEYLRLQCGRSHCRPCNVDIPSCKGLPDGLNVYQWREWSPYYAICRSQRVVYTGQCPEHPTLQIAQLFHAEKKRCVSVYEIPSDHSAYGFDCAQTQDGLYLDDVPDSGRPDVFYQCHHHEVVCVQRCGDGTYFDEELLHCSAQPCKNSILKMYQYPEGSCSYY